MSNTGARSASRSKMPRTCSKKMAGEVLSIGAVSLRARAGTSRAKASRAGPTVASRSSAGTTRTRSRSAWATAPRVGPSTPTLTEPPINTMAPRRRASAASSSINRVFPPPASPARSTHCGSPCSAAARARSRALSSSVRPTSSSLSASGGTAFSMLLPGAVSNRVSPFSRTGGASGGMSCAERGAPGAPALRRRAERGGAARRETSSRAASLAPLVLPGIRGARYAGS